jgi:hypothetical protein
MPDTEISKLPPLSQGQLSGADVLAIADVSMVETKKIRSDDLIIAGLAAVPDGTVDPNKLDWSILNSDSISGDDIADGSIADEKLITNTLTARAIAPNAIGASELADASVDTAAIQIGAVDNGALATNSVDSRAISSGGVSTDNIANLAVTYQKLGVNDGDIPGAKLAPNSVTANELAPSSVNTSELADGAATYAKLSINDGDIPGAKLSSNSVTATQLATNSVGASELADSSVDTAAIQVGAVDNGVLATNSVDDRVIQNSGVSTDNLINGAVTINKLSLNDDDLPGSLIANNTITPEELEDNLPGSIIADGTISGIKLSEGAVTESKIENGAVTTNKIRDAAVTDAKIANGINGAKIIDATVGPNKFTNDSFDRGVDNNGTNIGITNNVAPSTTSGITYNAQGLVTGSIPLVSADLPPATESDIGGISVPPGSGLTVSALGAIDHLTLVSAATRSGISYDEHGHITNTVPLVGNDLPPASTTELGGVSVPTTDSNPLIVSATGEIRHQTTGFLATNDLASVNVDGFGHVTGGSTQLTPSQVPGLDASIITTGQFGSTRIEDGSITGPKIDDYATCLMQEDFPGQGDFLGQFWYTPSTAQLRVYSRGSGPQNIWLPVGFGLLQQQNLRFAFTFDATTSTISSITQYGSPLGLNVGDPIPAATDINSGAYGVCVADGAGITLNDVNGVNFTIGDWILCAGEVAGWQHINTVDGGGGGGGAMFLNDLLDVTVPTPSQPLQDGQILQYNGDVGQWLNVPNAATVAIGDTPPSNANSGALWWDTESGRLFIWYEEETGSDQTAQWVPATPESGLTGSGDSPVQTLKFLNDLDNVEAGEFAGALLRYNSANLRWESSTLIDSGTFAGVFSAIAPPTPLDVVEPKNLNDLNDVNATNTDKAFLQYNEGTGFWESQLNFDAGVYPVVVTAEDYVAPSTVGTTTIENLNDFLDVEVQEIDEAYVIYNANLNRWEETTIISGGTF